jgi:hypothetical protein
MAHSLLVVKVQIFKIQFPMPKIVRYLKNICLSFSYEYPLPEACPIQSIVISDRIPLYTHFLLSSCTRVLHLASQLGLLLQLSRILDPEAMFEDLTDVLQRHPLNLRVTEIYSDPTEEANGGIEAKGSRRSCVFHLSKEGRRNNNVGTPA